MLLSHKGCPLARPAHVASKATLPGPFSGLPSTTVPMGSPGHPDPTQPLRNVCQLCWAHVLLRDRSRSCDLAARREVGGRGPS